MAERCRPSPCSPTTFTHPGENPGEIVRRNERDQTEPAREPEGSRLADRSGSENTDNNSHERANTFTCASCRDAGVSGDEGPSRRFAPLPICEACETATPPLTSTRKPVTGAWGWARLTTPQREALALTLAAVVAGQVGVTDEEFVRLSDAARVVARLMAGEELPTDLVVLAQLRLFSACTPNRRLLSAFHRAQDRIAIEPAEDKPAARRRMRAMAFPLPADAGELADALRRAGRPVHHVQVVDGRETPCGVIGAWTPVEQAEAWAWLRGEGEEPPHVRDLRPAELAPAPAEPDDPGPGAWADPDYGGTPFDGAAEITRCEACGEPQDGCVCGTLDFFPPPDDYSAPVSVTSPAPGGWTVEIEAGDSDGVRVVVCGNEDEARRTFDATAYRVSNGIHLGVRLRRPDGSVRVERWRERVNIIELQLAVAGRLHLCQASDRYALRFGAIECAGSAAALILNALRIWSVLPLCEALGHGPHAGAVVGTLERGRPEDRIQWVLRRFAPWAACSELDHGNADERPWDERLCTGQAALDAQGAVGASADALAMIYADGRRRWDPGGAHGRAHLRACQAWDWFLSAAAFWDLARRLRGDEYPDLTAACGRAQLLADTLLHALASGRPDWQVERAAEGWLRGEAAELPAEAAPGANGPAVSPDAARVLAAVKGLTPEDIEHVVRFAGALRKTPALGGGEPC